MYTSIYLSIHPIHVIYIYMLYITGIIPLTIALKLQDVSVVRCRASHPAEQCDIAMMGKLMSCAEIERTVGIQQLIVNNYG